VFQLRRARLALVEPPAVNWPPEAAMKSRWMLRAVVPAGTVTW
jgi:hypothetical protein